MNIKKTQGETSYKDTSFGIIPRSKLIPLEIEGIHRAWSFVLKKRNKSKIVITLDFIKKLHQLGFAWIFPKIGGHFRRVEVTVSNHTPPKFYLLPQLITDYCLDIKERLNYLPKIENQKFIEELIKFLAWSQHKFLWIHPFQDYNGRIARLLTNVILLNLDLPPIELKIETTIDRKKYITALQEADGGDFKKLENLIKVAVKESVKELEK